MKTRDLLLTLICVFLFSGCNNEELKQKTLELTLLKEQQKKDSLVLERFTKEMDEINSLLDTLAYMDEAMSEDHVISKTDALKKLGIIDSLLRSKNNQINDLTIEIENLKSKFSKSLAMGKLSEGQSLIEIKTKYYNELTKQIASLEQDNFDLKDIISKKNLEILERDSIINQINNERLKQQERLNELQSEIVASAKELADAKSATAERYYYLAVDLKNIADKTNVIFNKKKKQNLVQMAYDYFKRAQELGYEAAEKEVKFMETDKKYIKLLKGEDLTED